MWRSYIVIKVLSITKEVEFINKRKFATLTLYKNKETFEIYVATLLIALKIPIYPFQAGQLALLMANKALI